MNSIESAGTASVAFLEELFEQFQRDPQSLTQDWRDYFEHAMSPASRGVLAAGVAPGAGLEGRNGHGGRDAVGHAKPNGFHAIDENLIAPDGIATGHAVAVSNGMPKLPDLPAGEEEPLPIPASTSSEEERLAFLQDRVDQRVRAVRVRGVRLAVLEARGRP
ncbi:MAG: 2-oxoglutarate dehydrogenase E1 subunit family protein, partial [Planctomycetaceae bacterium]